MNNIVGTKFLKYMETKNERQTYIILSTGEGLEDLKTSGSCSLLRKSIKSRNQVNSETSEKLLKYLYKRKHWSPFEMVSVYGD